MRHVIVLSPHRNCHRSRDTKLRTPCVLMIALKTNRCLVVFSLLHVRSISHVQFPWQSFGKGIKVVTDYSLTNGSESCHTDGSAGCMGRVVQGHNSRTESKENKNEYILRGMWTSEWLYHECEWILNSHDVIFWMNYLLLVMAMLYECPIQFFSFENLRNKVIYFFIINSVS